MKIKKFTFIILIIVALTITSTVVIANGQPEIIASNSVVEKGTDSVDITLSVNNNPGIVSAMITVEFDNDVLTLLDVRDEGVLGSTSHSPLLESPYNLYWNNGAATENFNVNGKLATLTFKIKENAEADTYPIKITYDEDNILNVDMDSVAFDIKDGFIKVDGAEHQNGKSNETKDTSTSTGETVKEANKNESISNNINNQIILIINSKEISLFGKVIVNDVPPIIRNDRTMLPARFIAESLGATVNWYEKERKVEIVNDSLIISIFIDSSYAKVNNKDVELDSPAFIENDRTYLPVRFLTESLGATVDWDESTQKVSITK